MKWWCFRQELNVYNFWAVWFGQFIEYAKTTNNLYNKVSAFLIPWKNHDKQKTKSTFVLISRRK